MGIYILTRPDNAKSAVKLGYPVVSVDSLIPSGSKVIRWGNGLTPDKRGWEMVLNKAGVLAISTSKLQALEALARTVNVPEVYHHGDVYTSGHRYVERPENHAEGSDFTIVEGRNNRTCHGHHATRYIEDANEYRVWFVRDKYLIARRVPIPSKGQQESDPCRSKWGYKFLKEVFPKLKEEVAKARTAIPLDFGAIDVLWSQADSKWYFLEFNSAPSLDHDAVLEHFQTHLKAILGASDSQVVPEVVQTPQSAANRPAARERGYMEPHPQTPGSWEEKFEAKLRAERKAKEEAIYKKVYGDA